MKLHKYLPFEITHSPDPLDIKEVNPGVKGYYQRADDKQIVSDRTLDRSYALKVGVGLIIASIFFTAILGFELLFLIIIIFPLFFSGLFTIVYTRFAPTKNLVFNRMKGTVEIPGFLFQDSIIVPFTDLKVVLGWQGRGGPYSYFVGVIPPNKKWWQFFRGTEILMGGTDVYMTWAFILWYMDKNRPLPPGTAFDAYRKADNERIKREGNKEPLFPSKI